MSTLFIVVVKRGNKLFLLNFREILKFNNRFVGNLHCILYTVGIWVTQFNITPQRI